MVRITSVPLTSEVLRGFQYIALLLMNSHHIVLIIIFLPPHLMQILGLVRLINTLLSVKYKLTMVTRYI